MVLAGDRVKELESIRRGHQILGRGEVPLLGYYAEHHLQLKAQLGEATARTLGGVERCLRRTVEYFGVNRSLTSLNVLDVQQWTIWLRKKYAGRGETGVMSNGSVRHRGRLEGYRLNRREWRVTAASFQAFMEAARREKDQQPDCAATRRRAGRPERQG